MRKIVSPAFFDRPTLTVARDLIGKYLVRRIGEKTEAFMITETEAYLGPHDQASHAFRGRTMRNAPMYEGPGTIYVYFTYGIHWMLNIVCEDEGFPAAVLIRGLASDEMRLDGPARLTKHLRIDKMLNARMLGKQTGLWVEDRGARIPRNAITRTPRVGIPNRGVWTDKPWRFVLSAARATSPRTSFRGRSRRNS